MVIHHKRLVTNLALLSGLNPFIFSALTGVFKTDLNLLYLLMPTFFMVTQKKFWILGIVALIPLIEFKYAFHLINFFFVLELVKAKYTGLISQKIINASILLWGGLFLLEFISIDLHNTLFFRESSLFEHRGFSGFGPEPATVGLFILCAFTAFELSNRYRFMLLLMLVLTATPLIFLIPFFVLHRENYLQALLISTVAVALIFFVDFDVPVRLDFYYSAIKEFQFDKLWKDQSFIRRFNGLFIFWDSLKSFISGQENLNQFKSYQFVSSGLFVTFNKLGFIMLFIPLIILKKINSLKKLLIFLLLLFVGSGAHIMPLYYLLSKK